jgi:hypothetical protein
MASIISRLFPSKVKEAASPQLSGSPIVRYALPYNYSERNITTGLIAADRAVPVVLSSLVGLNRLCFNGFDHNLKPVDEGDDTQAKNIEKALEQIRIQEKRIGRVGKARKVGTLGLVRAAALDGWSFRQALSEYATVQEGNWLNFREIQHLPAQSFGQLPGQFNTDYLPDKILPGIIYDPTQDITRFFQTSGSTSSLGAKELDPEHILYIEDSTVPEDVSFVKALVPAIEQWKEIRRYGMTAERRVAVPNETAAIDAKDLVAMVASKIPVDVQKLIDYCKDLVEAQSYSNQKVAIPGVKLQYPNISMPLNPWEADAYLKKEIIDFFFHRDVLEVTTQAISATNAPAKDLLDLHIASERELWGKPYEGLWNEWLSWNGFELVDEFAYWNWAPADQEKERAHQLMSLNAGAMLINDYRERQGWPEYDDAQIAQLKEERQAIKPMGAGSQGALIGPTAAILPERST